MTCIVGLVDNGKVYIGGDSAGVRENWDMMIRADEKVFLRTPSSGNVVDKPMAFGFTTSFRMGQLLRYSLNIPLAYTDVGSPNDLMPYMATVFIDAVRECLNHGGYAEKENEVEKGGEFLVGWKGRLFTIGGDYQVGEAMDGFDATGNSIGAGAARGVLYATLGWRGETIAEERIMMALRAAERFDAGVRGPFHIVVTPE